MAGQVTPLSEAVRRWDAKLMEERRALLECLGCDARQATELATEEFDSLPQSVQDAMEKDVACPKRA